MGPNFRDADEIRIDEVDPRAPTAQHCLNQYYTELAARFSGGFELARSRDPQIADLLPPRGAFLVASGDVEPLGCVALKGVDGEHGEIKRLWVSPTARGRGVARLLMAAAERRAGALGMRRLRLDTNNALPEAAAFYRCSGWREIERFNNDPYAHVFFEKQLDPSAPPGRND